MNNYNESRKAIHALRCKDEVLFRMAVSHLMDVGIRHLTEENINQTCEEIMRENDKFHFMTNEYKCDLVRLAGELAKIDHIHLLTYISREMYYHVDAGFSYQHAIEIISKLIDFIEYDAEDCQHLHEIMKECDIDDEDLEFIGYGYMIPSEEEE